MTAWQLVERSGGTVVLVTDGATLLIEAPRLAIGRPDLSDVIARLAPHLAFEEPRVRAGAIERCARSGEERVVIGRRARGATSIGYLLAARVTVEIDDVVAEHLRELPSPFAYIDD